MQNVKIFSEKKLDEACIKLFLLTIPNLDVKNLVKSFENFLYEKLSYKIDPLLQFSARNILG